ncbi:MAG: hypothetical protein FWG84_02035 [Bacteroidales bacterium]|nr:hypothetical protein [Bacteroidales bacterium]
METLFITGISVIAIGIALLAVPRFRKAITSGKTSNVLTYIGFLVSLVSLAGLFVAVPSIYKVYHYYIEQESKNGSNPDVSQSRDTVYVFLVDTLTKEPAKFLVDTSMLTTWLKQKGEDIDDFIKRKETEINEWKVENVREVENWKKEQGAEIEKLPQIK